MDKRSRFACTALAATLLFQAPAQAAAQAVVRLDSPTATFPEDFGAIQTIRELRDGRVLVADPLAKQLYVVDLAAGTRRVVGASGQGPDEYLQPDAVWAFPGDSTLLVDLGNARLTVLSPDLTFRRTMPITQGEFRPGSPLVLALPQGVDQRGRLYFRSMNAGGEPADSGDVLRLGPTGSAEPVARFKLEDRTVSRSGGSNNQNVSVQPVPLSPQDAWGVARDGSVALARVGDVRLDWVGPDGTVTRGTPIEVPRRRIGTAEKEEWLADRARSGGGIGVSMEVENGRARMSLSRGGQGGGGAREIDRYTWPEAAPVFHSGRVPIDGLDRAWVKRFVAAGQPATYDVFDRRGRRVGTAVLGQGRRVVGFGEGAVYVVAFDEFDLNYLERYELPRFQ